MSSNINIESYAGLVQRLEGASCAVNWEGRTVTLKDASTLDLIELSTEITSFFMSRGCPSGERESLKSLNKKISMWIQETDKSVESAVISQFLDVFTYPRDVGPFAFWMPGFASVQVENLYTDKEWEEQFPGVVIPEPIKVIENLKLFSDEQIKKASEDAFEIY